MDHLTDRAIALLRSNGRLSYNELARRLGTNRTSVATRLNPLFEHGALRVTAAVHPRYLGFEVLAHLRIRSSGSTSAVARHLLAVPGAVFVSDTTGPMQLVAELYTGSLADLYTSVQRIRALPEVDEVEVLLYEQLLSSSPPAGSPLPAEPLPGEPPQIVEPLDAADLGIVEHLRVDGRLGYAELGRRIGLSTSAARNRVERLLASGAMRIGVTHGHSASKGSLVFGLGLVIEGETDRTIALLREEPGLQVLARSLGRFSLIATVWFTAIDEFEQLLDRLRTLPEVLHSDQWMHLTIHLEWHRLGLAPRQT